jgi:hypothetical protein
MNEPRKEQRRWRAWACWAMARKINPSWPADPKHAVTEPDLLAISAALKTHGLPGESDIWRNVLAVVAVRGSAV